MDANENGEQKSKHRDQTRNRNEHEIQGNGVVGVSLLGGQRNNVHVINYLNRSFHATLRLAGIVIGGPDIPRMPVTLSKQ
jgi:hypothetical protein